MPKIFLCYRRQDSAGVAGRIYDHLRAHFGGEAIFMDVDSMLGGRDFRIQIASAVDQCDVLLAVIGRNWTGEAGAPRRIDDPHDFVRIEIESALRRNLPVVPILIDRTPMPAEADLPPSLAGLAYCHAIDLDQGRDFPHHVERLINNIKRLCQQPNLGSVVPPDQPKNAAAVDAVPPPKIELSGANGSKSEVQTKPVGATRIEPASRPTPSSPRSHGAAVASLIPGAPPSRRNGLGTRFYLTVLLLLAVLGIIVYMILIVVFPFSRF